MKNMRGRILVVDDDSLVLESLHEIFVDDFDVVTASSGADALDIIRDDGEFDTVVLDIKMAGMDGLETAAAITKLNSSLPIIFYTGYPGDYSEGQIDRQYHPFDYVAKSDHPTRLCRAVGNAVKFRRLEKQSARLIDIAREEYGMVGKSSRMREIYRTIEKIAPTDSKVMIVGPTGSGKELVARAIHKRSARSSRRLGIFNCNHKQSDLVEAQLFGYLKGTFTGAFENRIGMFEYADGGTLFLDEISDLDATSQMKLLRVLETGEMQIMGSPEMKKVDVRVICATNKKLEDLVAAGEFREDLYFRLNGVTITLPALREHREDIPDLLNYAIEHYALQKGDGYIIFDPAAIDMLIEYDWPGNIRHLIYTVKALIDLSVSAYVTRKDVEKQLAVAGEINPSDNSFSAQLTEMKRLIIIKTLARADNNISAAARLLSMDRSNLHKMIKDLGISTG